MKAFFIMVISFLLNACTGDTLTFRHQGDALIKGDSICLTSSPGDVLSFYLLSSSLDNYRKPISMQEDISIKSPDTCIKSDVRKPANYDLMYIMDDTKYRVNFTVNGDGSINIHNR